TAQLAHATSRRSTPSGMIQPTSVRPAIANAVASPIAAPACCGPSKGVMSENRCATRPICANSPKAIPAASVRNAISLNSSEPGRHDRIDCYGTHCAPTRSAEQRGREQLPSRIRESPAKRADCERESGRLCDRRSAKASVKGRQIGSCGGADEEMRGNRRGYQGQWPARSLVHNAEKDGRSIESHSPTEDGENESSADHPPSVERAARCLRGCHAGIVFQCAEPRYGNDRSIRSRTGVGYGCLMLEFGMASNAMFATVASLVGDPARAGMLHALMDGRALTASELAQVGRVTAQTASGHLTRMAAVGLLSLEKQG